MSKKVRLTGQQIKAVEALLEGKSVTDAAEFAGVTRQTVHAWLNTPVFTQAIEQGQREIMRPRARMRSSFGPARRFQIIFPVAASRQAVPRWPKWT